jgi:(2Fe-2S) ferredoxin
MKFFQEAESRGLFGQVLITGTTCVGPCQAGTTVIVYPDGAWYQGVTPQRAAEIMERHIVKGKPVEEFFLPESFWG